MPKLSDFNERTQRQIREQLLAPKTPPTPVSAPIRKPIDHVAELGGRKIVISHEPVPAPRMTRRDKWLNPRRDCVQRYFDFRDFVQQACGDMPTVPHTIMFEFHIPMPLSWSNKKMAEMNGKKHRQRPDVDNLIKAVCDALFLEDGGVSDVAALKRWCRTGEGRIELEVFV